MATEEVSPCGKCGEWIQTRAVECRHCGAPGPSAPAAPAPAIDTTHYVFAVAFVMCLVGAYFTRGASFEAYIVSLSGAGLALQWLLIRSAVCSGIVAARRFK